MFTGIVQGMGKVKSLNYKEGILNYSVEWDSSFLKGLETGASVSIDGCCQTLVKQENCEMFFQAIPETLKLTTLGSYKVGQYVDVERSARIGDEIGGHILSGHIIGTAQLHKIEKNEAGKVVFFLKCPKEWMAYILPKGFIALDGASLTVVDVFPEGMFTVHLIPETLIRSVMGKKQEGDLLNLELDHFTMTIVKTVERVLQSRNSL